MKKKTLFDSCERCGGPLRTRRVTVDLRRGERLYVFYHVPVRVCRACGERYYAGPVLERLEEIAEHGMISPRHVRVPTFDYNDAG